MLTCRPTFSRFLAQTGSPFQILRRALGRASGPIQENIMNRHMLLAVLLTLCLGVAEWTAIQAADGDGKKDVPRPAVATDEDLLKTAGLTGDGPALLDFLRKRTVQSLDTEKIKSLIKDLDNDSFQVREQASKELVNYRKFAE